MLVGLILSVIASLFLESIVMIPFAIFSSGGIAFGFFLAMFIAIPFGLACGSIAAGFLSRPYLKHPLFGALSIAPGVYCGLVSFLFLLPDDLLLAPVVLFPVLLWCFFSYGGVVMGFYLRGSGIPMMHWGQF